MDRYSVSPIDQINPSVPVKQIFFLLILFRLSLSPLSLSSSSSVDLEGLNKGSIIPYIVTLQMGFMVSQFFQTR